MSVPRSGAESLRFGLRHDHWRHRRVGPGAQFAMSHPRRDASLHLADTVVGAAGARTAHDAEVMTMDKPVSNENAITGGLTAPAQGETSPAYAGTAVPGARYYQSPPVPRHFSQTPTEAAEHIGDQASAAAKDVAHQAGELARTTAESRKDEIAESIRKVAGALRSTRANLGDLDQSVLPQYVDKAADRVEQLSTYLRNHDVRAMVSDIERGARKEPALFLGGAFVLGFLGTRFFKSSSRSIEASHDEPYRRANR